MIRFYLLSLTNEAKLDSKFRGFLKLLSAFSEVGVVLLCLLIDVIKLGLRLDLIYIAEQFICWKK